MRKRKVDIHPEAEVSVKAEGDEGVSLEFVGPKESLRLYLDDETLRSLVEALEDYLDAL